MPQLDDQFRDRGSKDCRDGTQGCQSRVARLAGSASSCFEQLVVVAGDAYQVGHLSLRELSLRSCGAEVLDEGV